MNILRNIKEFWPLILFLGGCVLYASAMFGLPPRMDKAEMQINELRSKSDKAESTLNMVASDVRDIKNILMRNK